TRLRQVKSQPPPGPAGAMQSTVPVMSASWAVAAPDSITVNAAMAYADFLVLESMLAPVFSYEQLNKSWDRPKRMLAYTREYIKRSAVWTSLEKSGD
ncbi:MAG: hypothetical protein VX950_04785, partial [Pseudomonadota bacterium]|nr:hypothetical protein [Pseudomonadota bacterium]